MIYTYQCVKCKGTKDLMRKVKDRNRPVKCRKCKCEMIRRISGAHFKLLGEGFYKPSKEQEEI